MKKLLTVLVAIAMTVALAIPAFAGSEGEDLGEIPWTAADIVIDSVMDEAYLQGLHLEINENASDTLNTGLYGEAWILWKDGYLYAFFEVDDPEVLTPDPAKQMSQPWGTDNVEFFIDHSGTAYCNDEDTDSDLTNCIQYRLDVSGWPSVYGFKAVNSDETWHAYGENGKGDPDEDGNYADHYFEYAGNFTSNLYHVEYKIPLREGATAGDSIAIFVQIYDMYTGGENRVRIGPCTNAAGRDWAWNAQCWSNVTLGAIDESQLVNIVDPEVTEPAAPVVDDTPVVPVAPSNPTTADLSVIFYALASLSAVGGLSLIGKKK